MTTKIRIEDLDRSLQPRVETKSETVSDYAEAMRDGAKFPPVTVYRESKNALPIYLADGFHRVAALAENGVEEVEAEVKIGSRADAIQFAFHANLNNGERITNADKQHMIEMAMANSELLFPDPQGKDKNGKANGLPSSRQLEAVCPISHYKAVKFLQKLGMVEYTTPPAETAAEAKTVKANLKEGKDRFGEVIPASILPAFTSTKATGMMKTLRNLNREFRKALKDRELDFAALATFGVDDFEKLINSFKFGLPYCVCRGCHGTGCGRCSGRGFQTLSQFGRNPPEYQPESARKRT